MSFTAEQRRQIKNMSLPKLRALRDEQKKNSLDYFAVQREIDKKEKRRNTVERVNTALAVVQFCEHIASQKIDWGERDFETYLGFLEEEVPVPIWPRKFTAEGVTYTPHVRDDGPTDAERTAQVQRHFKTARQRGEDPMAFELPSIRVTTTWTSSPRVPKEEMGKAISEEHARWEKESKEACAFNSGRFDRARRRCEKWLHGTFPRSVALYGMTIVLATDGTEEKFVANLKEVRDDIRVVKEKANHHPVYSVWAFIQAAQRAGLWEEVEKLISS